MILRKSAVCYSEVSGFDCGLSTFADPYECIGIVSPLRTKRRPESFLRFVLDRPYGGPFAGGRFLRCRSRLFHGSLSRSPPCSESTAFVLVCGAPGCCVFRRLSLKTSIASLPGLDAHSILVCPSFGGLPCSTERPISTVFSVICQNNRA